MVTKHKAKAIPKIAPRKNFDFTTRVIWKSEFAMRLGISKDSERKFTEECRIFPIGDCTVSRSNKFADDLGVKFQDGTALTAVAFHPIAGQYSVNAKTGVYTFAASDAGKVVVLNYAVTSSILLERAIDRFRSLLSDMLVKREYAKSGPLLVDHVAAQSGVLDAVELLYERLTKLGETYRHNLPDADIFTEQLREFGSQLTIHIWQMKVQKNLRGGARKAEEAKAKDLVLHAFRTFFDLHAIDSDGELRSSRLEGQGSDVWEPFLKDRDAFVAWVAGSMPWDVNPDDLLPPNFQRKSAASRRKAGT
jgi:hypothetical protein